MGGDTGAIVEIINSEFKIMQTDLYNQSGEVIGKTDLPDNIFSLKMNPDLMHQVINAQMANSRKVLAHTKDRSEVRGGGKKPWRQKGTGRARHGSSRSPLWRGGGVTFGPTKERNFSKGINKKMKRKALFMALSSKVASDNFLVFDDIKLEQAKVKKAAEILNILLSKFKERKAGKKKNDTLLLSVAKKSVNLVRATNNLSFVKLVNAKDLNVLDTMSVKFILMDQNSIAAIKETFKI